MILGKPTLKNRADYYKLKWGWGSKQKFNFRMRIFMDYSFMQVGGSTEINLIKRAMNISANYFYNIIQVNRLSRLQYPSDSPKTCTRSIN